MPRKVFVAGEILTAADVNTNLADQAVMTFAGTAARGSAIGTAVEGMVTYLEDTNQLEVYGGTAIGWSSASNFLFGTATPTDGQVVSYSTAVSGYVPADAAGGGGKVLQVVSATKTDSSSTTSSSLVDIPGLSVSLTPSSASNKVLILAHTNATKGASADSVLQLTRDSTDIAVSTSGTNNGSYTGNINDAASNNMLPISIQFLDSPATTSSITYKLRFSTSAGGIVINGVASGNYGAVSTITAMEIAG